MAFKLPQERTEPIKVNPNTLLILSVCKMGKTTILSKLPKCLVLDLEGGSDFVGSGTFIDVRKEAEAAEVTSLEMLRQISKAIMEEGYPYDYIAIDPITSLEDVVKPLAVKKYKETPMGKNYKGDDVTKLPNGAGYLYAREAFKEVYQAIGKLAPHLIMIGHIKDKQINKRGEEVSVRDLDLTGKLSRIVAQDVDAIAIMYAKENERYLSFKKQDLQMDFDSITGNRIARLSGNDFLISRMEDDLTVETFWENIFINNG